MPIVLKNSNIVRDMQVWDRDVTFTGLLSRFEAVPGGTHAGPGGGGGGEAQLGAVPIVVTAQVDAYCRTTDTVQRHTASDVSLIRRPVPTLLMTGGIQRSHLVLLLQ